MISPPTGPVALDFWRLKHDIRPSNSHLIPKTIFEKAA